MSSSSGIHVTGPELYSPAEAEIHGEAQLAEITEIGRFKLRTLKQALSEGATAPPWVIQDILLRDSATLVSAHPHSMKSLSLLCASMQAVATQSVWGHFSAPSVQRSLFIETEDPQWIVEARIRGLAKGLGLSDDLPGFYYSCVPAFDLVDTEKEIIELLNTCAPDFAVLSTLQSLLGHRDWSRQPDMSDVNALIVRLSRICPLIVVTHSPWDKKQKRAAGTITQTANYMTTAHLVKTETPKGETFVHVLVDSKAGAKDNNFSLKLETDGQVGDAGVRSVAYAGPGWVKGSAREAVIEAMEENPDANNKEIAEHIDCSVRYVQTIRKELAKKKSKRVREQFAEDEE